MKLPDDIALLATVCNTTPNAVPFTLWYACGADEYLVDLSDVLGLPGDGGLTGLACVGDRIYAAVQSSDAPRILVLDRALAHVATITHPQFKDIHSLHGMESALLVCSTAAQSVLRVDIDRHEVASSGVTTLCTFDSPVHLNSACFDGADLLVCCHYPERVIAGAMGGGVINATHRQVVLGGLTQPHSLTPNGSGYLILDSDGRRIIRFDHTGVTGQQALSGFPRGIATANGALFVASSAGRVISRKNPVAPPGRQFWQAVAEPPAIHELDEWSLARRAMHIPLIAGFEIYELLAFSGAGAIAPAPDRLIRPDPLSLARAYYEAAKHALAQRHQRP
ncbi:MAG: hypothetical protein WDN25_15500 [Acetobacteraceae bacterium]